MHDGANVSSPELTSRSNPYLLWYLLILPTQGVLFLPAKGKQTAPTSKHIFFPFGQGASEEYTMRNEIMKQVTKAGRNEALSFSSGFSAQTLQELLKKKQKQRKRKQANNEEFLHSSMNRRRIKRNNPGRHGHRGSIAWPKVWRPHSARYSY